MEMGEVIRVSLRALARNKMRTVLTMLGIIIGVGAVICTVAIGQGASNQVQQQIQSLGDNMIFISAGSINKGGVHMGSQATKTLTAADGQAIVAEVPFIKWESPVVGYSAQIVYGGNNWFTHTNGVNPEYIKIRHWNMAAGSFFSKMDVDVASNVCVLGQTVVKNLFSATDDPVGKTVRINNMPFRVIGVLAAKGSSPFGQDEDDIVMMPYTTVQKKLEGINWIHFMMLSADSMDDIQPAEDQISALLRQRHHLRTNEENDFIIRSPTDFTQARVHASNVMTVLLASIASVSLLVGGIGIMNIMLVSVTERTREIGVRMAIGATESDVQRQFLSEAMVLSLIGGMVGIVAGVLGSDAVSRLFQWPTLVSPFSILIAAVFSGAVGIFFGYYPARRAAQLDPIEALRYE
ncbi:MAG TPA: ABC transporter permease [Candidatus Acidoferrales bacterium]|nr:ABC transporter permease [Candidatus Acidoferrales bacterium]